MKKLLFSAIVALTVAGVTQAGESTEFGVLCVPSSAAQTIVAVPWVGSGTSGNVRVADLVLTAGLNENDELKYYNSTSGQYECWKLTSGQWVASNAVTDSGVAKIAGADGKEIPRGEAIILKRGGTIANQFYIMGKSASGTGSLTLPSTGSLSAPVYALVAPPKLTDTDVNSFTWTGLSEGNDQLVTSAGKRLTWLGDKWSGKDNARLITAGTGVWFVSRGEGTKSVTW